MIGRYLLCDEIAAWGMATVHIGRLQGSAGFARTVAIKRLHPQFAKDPEFVAMFMDEARIASRIGHPNVVATIDVVVTDGELFVAMEYVHGEALSRLCRASRARTGRGVPPNLALSIISGVLYGLHAAHDVRDEQGASLEIVHRDVSPQNVLVGQDGIPRIVDFGVAKATGRLQMTREGALKGKLAYMSPEQVACEGVDRRTDIYAASVVLWEMLAGQRLFTADNEAGVLQAVLRGDVQAPSLHSAGISPEIDALVLKGLSRDRTERFATAWEMAEAAQQLGHATPGQIGTWVRGLAGPSLDQRATRVAEIEGESRLLRDDVADDLSDARSTVVRGRPQPKTLVLSAPETSPRDAEPPPSQVSAFNLTPPPPTALFSRSQRTRAWIVVGLALLLVGALFGLLRGSFISSQSAALVAAEPSSASARAATALPPAEVRSEPAQPSPAAVASGAGVEPASSAPRRPAAKPEGSAPILAPRAPTKSACSPPYTVDAAGVRVPKMECL